jgi:hypothetical protein
MKIAISALGLMMALAGCGGSDDGGTGSGGSGATACTAQKGFCGTLALPTTFNATPAKIIVGLYKQLGAAGPSGPPDAIAMQAVNPTISPTMPFAMTATELTVSGDYYVYAALYVQGGGMFQPVAGTDYVAQTAQTVSLGGATSPDIGTLQLSLAH